MSDNSPAPEVLAKLAEVDEEARENSVHGSPGKNFLERAAVYRAALEAALTALAAAQQQMHDMEAGLAKELNARAREVHDLRDQLAAATREAAELTEAKDAAYQHIYQLREALTGLRRKHYVCEDCWYACPKSGEACGVAERGLQEGECTCGADAHNAKIDAALAPRSPEGEGR